MLDVEKQRKALADMQVRKIRIDPLKQDLVNWARGMLSSVPMTEIQLRPIKDYDKALVILALTYCGWSIQRAGKRLGLGKSTMYRRIEQYDLRILLK